MTNEISNKPLTSTPKGYPNGYNPNGLANLVKGRAKLAEMRKNGELTNPSGYSLTAALKHTLHEEAEFISPTARPKDKLWREQIVRAILAKSALGDVGMVKELLDRVDGSLQNTMPVIDNRQVNIYVTSEKAKELTENAGRRLLKEG